MKEMHKSLIELVKYGLVGVLNTLICLGLIFLCKSVLGINEYVSNGIGYAAGFINSFFWNKSWVFRSTGGVGREAVLFVAGFGVCYALQLLTVWAITKSAFGQRLFDLGFFTLSGYGVATLIGNIQYTLTYFIYNKFITFSPKP